MSDRAPRVISVPTEPIFRWLFYSAHIAIPLVAVWLLMAHFWFCVELSWQLLAVVAVALLPVLLPLVCVYVGKAFGIELNDWPRSSVVPPPSPLEAPVGKAAPPKAQDLLVGAAAVAPETVVEPKPTPMHQWPHPNALALEEKKVIRTLWKEQKRYIAEGRAEYWGFAVRSGSPDFGEFVRGFSSLAQRGLVMQWPWGIIFLTQTGIEYCKLNEPLLDMMGDAWTRFVPA